MKDQRVTSGFQTAEDIHAKKNPVDAATSSGVRVSIAKRNEENNTAERGVSQANCRNCDAFMRWPPGTGEGFCWVRAIVARATFPGCDKWSPAE